MPSVLLTEVLLRFSHWMLPFLPQPIGGFLLQVTGSKLEHMEKKISVDMASVIGMATTHHKNKKVIVLTSYNNDAIMGVDYRSGRQVGVVFDDSLSLSLSLSLSHTHTGPGSPLSPPHRSALPQFQSEPKVRTCIISMHHLITGSVIRHKSRQPKVHKCQTIQVKSVDYLC